MNNTFQFDQATATKEVTKSVETLATNTLNQYTDSLTVINDSYEKMFSWYASFNKPVRKPTQS